MVEGGQRGLKEATGSGGSRLGDEWKEPGH